MSRLGVPPPIILPLVPSPFWGYLCNLSQVSSKPMTGWGTPVQDRTGWGASFRTGLGTPMGRAGLDTTPTPIKTWWGYPPSQGQDKLCMDWLRHRWYVPPFLQKDCFVLLVSLNSSNFRFIQGKPPYVVALEPSGWKLIEKKSSSGSKKYFENTIWGRIHIRHDLNIVRQHKACGRSLPSLNLSQLIKWPQVQTNTIPTYCAVMHIESKRIKSNHNGNFTRWIFMNSANSVNHDKI